jgi:hypothetical protein
MDSSICKTECTGPRKVSSESFYEFGEAKPEHSEYECPNLDWYALQVGLEHTESDVLILLDACCSAGASNLSSGYDSNQGGRTEIIAACGFDETTHGESFTRVLIGELKRMANDDHNFDQQISALQLHGKMLESMRYQNLPESDGPGVFLKSDHRFSTPVHMSLTRDHSQPSIPLKRFPPQVARSRGSSIRSIGSQPTTVPADLLKSRQKSKISRSQQMQTSPSPLILRQVLLHLLRCCFLLDFLVMLHRC